MRMKKIFPIFLALIASFGVLSCDIIPQPQVDPDGSQYQAGPALEILSKSVVFTPQGGTGVIVVNTTAPLTAKSDRGWIEVSVSGNRATLTVSRNESIESRYSTISLKAGGASAEVTAQQFGINSAYAWDESYTFPFAGGELTLPYGEAGSVWVDVTELPWLSAEVDEENKTIAFTAARSIYNWERKGDVSVRFGEDIVKEIRFYQEANPAGINPGDPEPVEFVLQADWTPKYVDPAGPDDPTSVVGVDVAEDSHAGRYFIKVVTKAEYAAGSDEQLFLNRNAPVWAEESPQIFRASSTIEIEKLALGDYRVYAIGVDNQNRVNGSYAVTEFSVIKVLSPYEKFLGTWSFDRNGTEDVWTVTEKVAGKTYSITGIDGITDVAVEAEFNADGTVTVRAQKELGEHTVNTSSGEVTGQAAIYGRILYSGAEYYVTGTYAIFTISFDDSKATTGSLAPGKVKISAGEFDLVGFGIYTIVGDSAYASTNKASLPAKITHLTWASGSGDDPGDDPGDNPGTDGYAKWLGTWNAGSGRTITVAQDEAGSTYEVTDSGYDDFVYYSWYDASTGQMLFRAQQVYEYDIDLYYFIGLDGNSICFGTEEDNSLIARGALSADGKSATVTGVSYTAKYQDGSTADLTVKTLTILDYQTEDGNGYEKGWYGLSSVTDLDLPATLTKASSASTMSVASSGRLDLDQGKFVKASRKTIRQKARKIQ